MAKNFLFILIILVSLGVACRLTTPTPMPTSQLSSPQPTIALVLEPTESSTSTPTSNGPCTLVADGDITIFDRPSLLAQVFSTMGAGFSIEVGAQSADGWLGFDPGVAQAANMGSFRLRWVDPHSAIHLEGTCQDLPLVWAPPPGVCFIMPMEETTVYSSPDSSSTPLATLAPGYFAAVLGHTGGDWSQVDLSPGNTGLTGTGWIDVSSLNYNGPCDSLPAVTP
jgi:hypothetical protein